MLTLEGCRRRQERFLAALEEAGVPAALVYEPRDIYYLTGLLPEAKVFPYPNVLFLGPGLASWLITGAGEGEAAVEERIHYPIGTMYTLNPDNHRRVAELVADRMQQHQTLLCLGYQREALPLSLAAAIQDSSSPGGWIEIDEILQGLQLRKDPDEIECIRRAVAATLAGYTRAQQVIEPGVTELHVLTECQQAAQRHTGTPHFHGGDYRSGLFGGPARDRRIEKGELYIIDAWSDVDGYWCDMARTWVVGEEPTDLQASVYAHIAGILTSVPQWVKPGLDTTRFWHELDARIREHPYLADRGLKEHGGHGIGTRVHEMPDLNRDRGGTFEVGNVFTCEPGAYADELNAGVRVENVFVVTPEGARELEPYPLSLVQNRRG